MKRNLRARKFAFEEKLMSRTILLVLVAAVAVWAPSVLLGKTSSSHSIQVANKTLVERLGYPADAKLLIVHADDLGLAHSVNAAAIKAFESGLVTAGSIMVPCPWLPEIAAYARSHPQADLGLHLTLTSEWTSFRWGPVLPKNRVSSLLDRHDYFHLTEAEAASHADVKEVETEVR